MLSYETYQKYLKIYRHTKKHRIKKKVFSVLRKKAGGGYEWLTYTDKRTIKIKLAIKTKNKYNIHKEVNYLSADNGIYILKTKDNQYRVIYASAIENLYWNPLDPNSYNKLIPTRIIELYGKLKYTYDKNLARDIAFNMAKNTYLEYGISEIVVDKTWSQIIKEAKEIAPLEIKYFRRKNDKYNNKWDIERLEEIINM